MSFKVQLKNMRGAFMQLDLGYHVNVNAKLPQSKMHALVPILTHFILHPTRL
jgi:hypothetical protein